MNDAIFTVAEIATLTPILTCTYEQQLFFCEIVKKFHSIL
jgi:hypothetical protein